MREDMRYVVIERPRTGGGWARPQYERKRNSKIPLKRESTGRHRQFGWSCKNLNDFLSPLRRFFISKIGQRFDDVWSEVCKGLGGRGTLQQHVLDHAKYMVEQNCFLGSDGIVYWRSYYRGFLPLPPSSLYVLDGILLETPPEKKRRYKHQPADVKEIDGHVYQLRNNIWFERVLSDRRFLPPQNPRYRHWDYRQLNKKELKKLGL